MPTIKLQSSDGQLFPIEVAVAVKCSGMLRNMLEDLGIDETTTSGEQPVIPVPQVNSAILGKVLQWANYHKDDDDVELAEEEEFQSKEKRTDDIGSWDADFLKVDQGMLFEVMLAANYLDMRGLLDVACKTVANMIKGKNVEEVRKTFKITNDFTAGEEEQVRLENEWCEEK